MRFRAHRTFRLGPFFVTLTERGLTGWGLRIGRVGHDFGRRTSWVDTPGWGGFTHRHGRRRRR